MKSYVGTTISAQRRNAPSSSSISKYSKLLFAQVKSTRRSQRKSAKRARRFDGMTRQRKEG
eukprot:CAMPEP_0170742808 /NCGR_PEP_ID=MMETSP0437-20130122/6936_1 /TAXON_ID=0 /ORGANISM="Sexangularia sp." /LENGTH=60 /DNA_ID=CAMNT_0011081443 /DNA_START=44 /DNA_END=223 /DNA_ORIENTATION=-